MGLAGLDHLPEFIERTRQHAGILDDVLGNVPGVTIPQIPDGRTHVYYQYCAYVPDGELLVKRCIRRGVDVAPMHVDVCTRLNLFGWTGRDAPGADEAATAVQVPIYESLQDAEVDRIGRVVRQQVERLTRTPASRVVESRVAAAAAKKTT
jgi:dTDP-4-amino-4,6-dideoxygalactose transaminase